MVNRRTPVPKGAREELALSPLGERARVRGSPRRRCNGYSMTAPYFDIPGGYPNPAERRNGVEATREIRPIRHLLIVPQVARPCRFGM